MLVSLSSREKLQAFIQALQHVIDRHDILRTAVLWEQLPQPVQVVYRRASLPVQEIAVASGCSGVEELRELMKPQKQRLDLRQAPLMRLEVVADPESAQWHALLQTHHLICDNASLEILLSEVKAHLEGRTQGLPEPLPYR